ncbi:MAG TPA: response regulator transcription factor [Gammaproteobacteria bacterium]|nr:response regulator transcription factor [Gammaproteobacteria bacterium]
MTSVFIAEDHTIVREGLKQILTECPDIEISGEAADGIEAIQKIRNGKMDVVLLDISIPGKNGLEVLKWIKSRDISLPVLMLSMHDEDQFALRSLRAGASGYLTKQSAPEQLVNAIRKVASGGKYITPAVAEKLANSMDPSLEKAPHERLTDREDQVFRLLISGNTVSEIAKDLSLSVKTISTHRTNILKKMNLHTNAELMYYAMSAGLGHFANIF